MKEKLKNLPFVIKVVLSFLIAILLAVSFFCYYLLIDYFGLLFILGIISGIIVITIFTVIIYYIIFID